MVGQRQWLINNGLTGIIMHGKTAIIKANAFQFAGKKARLHGTDLVEGEFEAGRATVDGQHM